MKLETQGKVITVKADRDFYQKLITAYHAGRIVDLDEVLKHELMKVPISIASTNGALRTGTKAILADVMTKDVKLPPNKL
jgi:hypothetical protein